MQENIPLASLTTFNIGGNAKFYIEVGDFAELKRVIKWAKKEGIQYVVLSGCSNVLVPDDGLDALVIRFVSGKYDFAEDTLVSNAGCNLEMLIRKTAKHGLSGWESMAGIPGSIGGAVRGNAGAFGTEIKDVLESVSAWNTKTGEVKTFINSECKFTYRYSFFKQRPDWIITKVIVHLQKGNRVESKIKIEQTIAERNRRHLQNVQAAGSFFINPVASKEIQEVFESEKGVKSIEGRVPAGWIIEKVGMKGTSVGGAQSSKQNPNYIINNGKATALEVLQLAKVIKEKVKREFHIVLEEEVKIL